MSKDCEHDDSRPRLYIYPTPSTIVHQLGLVIVGATLAGWRWLALSSYQTNWKLLSHGFGSIPSLDRLYSLRVVTLLRKDVPDRGGV
jgi:hypothetical protein